MQLDTRTLPTTDTPSPAFAAQADAAIHLVGEISNWLEDLTLTQTEPKVPLTWHAQWRQTGVALRSAEHLATLVSALKDEEFGGVGGPIEGRWVQMMRVSRHWLVEVRHESFDYPRRVHWGEHNVWPGRHSRNGQPWEVELFSSLRAADIAWTWMRQGLLPAGISHTTDFYHPGS